MICVVAGLIRREGRVLLCRRKPGGSEGSKWEFPGGKLESGETPEAALERELFEELGVRTRTGGIVDALRRDAGGRDLLILFYESELCLGEPEAIDCAALQWVEPARIPSFDLASVDRLFFERMTFERENRIV